VDGLRCHTGKHLPAIAYEDLNGQSSPREQRYEGASKAGKQEDPTRQPDGALNALEPVHHPSARSLLAFALDRSRRIRSAPVIALGPSDGLPFSFVTSGSVTGGFVTLFAVTGAVSAMPSPVCQSHNHGVRATMRSSARPFLRVESEGCIIGLK
jgi:hypothetical protein